MKFLLTKELGRLAKWLRILGMDAASADSPHLGVIDYPGIARLGNENHTPEERKN
jgi:hypothetical protein